MATRLRLRELIDTLNRNREAAGLPAVSDRSIAQAAGVNVMTFHRLTQNTRAGAKEFLDVMDRIMDVLDELVGREIAPADVIERIPAKRASSPKVALTKQGRRRKPAKDG